MVGERGLAKTRLRHVFVLAALGSAFGRPKAMPGLCRTSRLVWAGKIGRRERIRTSGPYVPNVVLYQAELLSEPVRWDRPLASGGALITMPPRPRNRPPKPWQGGNLAGLRPGAAGFIRVRAGGPVPAPAGASPSGKALDFDSSIRRF